MGVVPCSYYYGSVLREIPDNQEVFISKDTDISLIVELLEYCTETNDGDSAAFFFKVYTHTLNTQIHNTYKDT